MNLPSPLLRLPARRALTAVMAVLSACLWITAARAEESAKATSPTPEQEAKFVATLTNATLKGADAG